MSTKKVFFLLALAITCLACGKKADDSAIFDTTSTTDVTTPTQPPPPPGPLQDTIFIIKKGPSKAFVNGESLVFKTHTDSTRIGSSLFPKDAADVKVEMVVEAAKGYEYLFVVRCNGVDSTYKGRVENGVKRVKATYPRASFNLSKTLASNG